MTREGWRRPVPVVPGRSANGENAAEVTAQTDIFSLGVLLKECYTKLSPMEAFQKRIKLDWESKQTDIALLEESELPKDIQAIVEKATIKDLTQRYQKISELTQDLENYQHHRSISAREDTLAESLHKWYQRNKQNFWIGTLLFTLILSAGLSIQFKDYYQREKNFKEKFSRGIQKKEKSFKKKKTQQIPLLVT